MKSCRSEIERLIPTVRQFARALVEDHRADHADDLVHDALDDAFRGERGWTQADAEFRLFSRVIAANRARLRLDADQRNGFPSVSSAHGEGTSFRPMPMPRRAATGLDALPLSERETLLLVVLGQLDYPKVAEVLGVSVGTVVARLTQARDRLGDSLWANGGGARSRAAGHLRLVKS